MFVPRTPNGKRNGQELHQLVDLLNEQFALELPNPQFYSPSVLQDKNSLRWKCYGRIKRLYYAPDVDLNRVLNSLEEFLSGQLAPEYPSIRCETSHAAGAGPGRSGRDLLMGGYGLVSEAERDKRLVYLDGLLGDEISILGNGSFTSNGRGNGSFLEKTPCLGSRKRRLSTEDEAFHTDPNSPVKYTPPLPSDEFGDAAKMENMQLSPDISTDEPVHVSKTPKTSSPAKGPSKFVEKLTAPDNYRCYDAVAPAISRPEFSFTSTVADTSIETSYSNRVDPNTSFMTNDTELTEPMPDSQSVYEQESVVGHLLSQEMRASSRIQKPLIEQSTPDVRYSDEQRIMNELINEGPFSLENPFPRSVSLRYRYELERIGRAWNVPLKRMLVGDKIQFKSLDTFWSWIATHNQREGKPLPGKSSSKAWDSAVKDFTTDKHSENVALTGDLEWCDASEPGILKLSLNPLRVERTCRFHRRFGSDRFLSLTIPAPARPPRHLRMPDRPALLRETIAMWLQRFHHCLGRTWRAFYLEEVKSKRKVAEPRFRVEFFAIDGVDFRSPLSTSLPAPRKQDSTNHTAMDLDSLLDWHMGFEANRGQTNCKLFQRLSLGLSKTFATVSLRPNQIIHLADGYPVMNDGCALMARALANQICDSLGLTGNTPSCFQGRIAGAKGLWMVDKHQSHLSANADDVWIQITDSQLKIEPHPQTWREPVDEEQLTFEVVKWSKPLHPVHLNIQLLAILEHCGNAKEHIADLTRLNIQSVYKDFAEVVQSDNPVLCRNLIQKIRSLAEDGSKLLLHKTRRMEQWMMNETETLIRLTEAGFTPRSFYPLRQRLGRCLRDVLDRYVEELHIEVPLSTYAFCIADPYGVLKEDEVHFGFSANWRDGHGEFEDNLLDGVDVLVGRLPAHLPSDIQRRKAVWKAELRHFQDVIVFPSVGKIPLAHMLSGGDYDGDMPWICWDQNIARNFRNSNLPDMERPPEYFGVKSYAVPMKEISGWDEFLLSSMTFNLMLSNLGRCTVEREKLGYDEPIDSLSAIELSCLLSVLVDARKSGHHLGEAEWQIYRKKISPKARALPAYKDPDRKPKMSNIIDYLKFRVARKERDYVLTQLEQTFPEQESRKSRDEALVQPWNEARKQADQQGRDGPLHAVLEVVAREIDGLYRQYVGSFNGGSFSTVTEDITDRARTISLPITAGHQLIYVWQHNPNAWQQLLASYTYQKRPDSSFWLHTFGEILCEMKANSLPSRTVAHEVLACYRVNPKAVVRLTAQDALEEGDTEEDGEAGEYEGHEAIEAMLFGTQMQAPGGYYDPDDSTSVE